MLKKNNQSVGIVSENYKVEGTYDGFTVWKDGKVAFKKNVRGHVRPNSKDQRRKMIRDWYVAAKHEIKSSESRKDTEELLFQRLQRLRVG